MVPLMALWMPILLSAVLVFVASFIIHMVLPYHHGDMRKAPAEDQLLEALRKSGVSPGDYVIPRPESHAQMKTPEFMEKMKRGPVVFMTVMPGGSGAMGKSLVQWFSFCVVVGIFTAYVTGRALGPGTEYLRVFRLAGCTAFMGYALAIWQNSIWYKRAWSTTLKSSFDGLVYGLLSAGAFGWLWP